MSIGWKAQWIWNEESVSPRNEWRCFRKSFMIKDNEIDSAAIRITADSRYVLFVNGIRVGRGPVRSWPFEQSYDTYEIGHLLQPGKQNTIAALVLHFGVSTFYYLRGRGGLLLELSYNNQSVFTDHTWKTARHVGQHPRAPRMSCQQAFSEYIDARAWSSEWVEPNYDDTSWDHAYPIGPAGMEPWHTLRPRDIPMLSEETVYPSRIDSLAKIKTFSLTTAIDVRNALVAGSEDHANPVEYTGFVVTALWASAPAKATIGFLQWTECMQACTLNGVILSNEHIYGVEPERYLDVELKEGNNLLVIDVSGRVHTGKLQIGVAAEEGIELAFADPLAGEEAGAGTAFYRIGPFDSVINLDHQEQVPLNWENPVYTKLLAEVKTAADLMSYSSWLHKVDESYVSEVDVFSLCVYRKEAVKLSVPAQLQHAVVPGVEAGIVPQFDGYDTELVIDFGKEYSGYLRFEVEASEGTILDWYGFEYKRDDYRQETYGLDHTLRYVCHEGRQTYETPIRRGFRYLALNIREAISTMKIYGVEMIQSNYPVAEVGHFECSDGRLNDIWEISRHTTKLCMEDTFVDCPAYEQAFWVGDSRNEALVNNYLFGAGDIVKRCLRLVPGSKHQTPLYVDQVPSGWSSVIPNWTFFWAIACYEHYEQTDDMKFAEEMYEHIRFTLHHYLKKIDSNGLFNVKGWNLLDWSPIDQPNDGVVAHQNMFLACTLRLAAQMGRLVGDNDDSGRFAEAADVLTHAINKHLWNEEKQAYIDCIHADGRRSDVLSMQTQVVAVLTGVAEQERRHMLEQYLITPPAGFVQIGSPFMSFFYYEALEKLGQGRLMLDDIRVNYGNMLDHGATTCWEQYPNFLENRANSDMLTRSHCHAWSAAPAYFLGRELLGVRPLATGWTSVEVAPVPNGLAWARGSVPHPAGGRIDVSWKAEEGSSTMHIRIEHPEHAEIVFKAPDGYRAELHVIKLESTS